MLNNVGIIASTLVPLSLALCISWWHRRARCFTQCCVTLVVTLEYQRALCKWQTALCTTHVAWYYIIRALHWRILAAHALFLSISCKPSASFSKVSFKAMGPWCKAPGPSMHEGGRCASQWPTMCLRDHPILCCWGMSQVGPTHSDAFSSQSQRHSQERRWGKETWDAQSLARRSFSGEAHTHVIWIQLWGIQRISSQNESDYLNVLLNDTEVS